MRSAARASRVLVGARPIVIVAVPVGTPLPNIARQIVKTVAICLERFHRPVVKYPSLDGTPCQVFARKFVPALLATRLGSIWPPRAANSHSASVGSLLPAQ